MKKIMLYMLGGFILCSSAVLAQQDHTHFDGKNYIEGEMLVQLKANYGMRGVISKLPLHWQAKQDWEVSKPMRIWLVKFDHTQVTHTEFQNFLYQVEGVSIVDYNYKVKHHATVATMVRQQQLLPAALAGLINGKADQALQHTITSLLEHTLLLQPTIKDVQLRATSLSTNHQQNKHRSRVWKQVSP